MTLHLINSIYKHSMFCIIERYPVWADIPIPIPAICVCMKRIGMNRYICMKQSPSIGIGTGGNGIGDLYWFFEVIYVKKMKESVRIGNIQINR